MSWWVGGLASWWVGELMGWWVDEVMSWQVDELSVVCFIDRWNVRSKPYFV